MRLSTLAWIALATTLQPATSSSVEASAPTSEGGKGLFESLLDKSSQVAGAIYEEFDSLSTSAHQLFDGLHLVEVGESLWDTVVELGLSADGLFHHAIDHPPEKILEFKASVDNVIITATTLNQVVLEAAEQRGIPPDFMKDDLAGIFNDVFELLKKQFPPPEEASGHENRTVMVDTFLNSIEESFLEFAIKHGVSEEPLKSHSSSLKFHVQFIVVTIGDLVEQHPELAMTLMLFVTTEVLAVLLPELLLGDWLLGKVLDFVGFGPLGPTKGSFAAFLQRWLFGSAVPKGGWFAMLQRLAMKAVKL